MKIVKITILILFITLYSCDSTRINTDASKNAYSKSVKSFSGKLNTEDFKQIRESIVKELNIQIPEDKSILINYFQNGEYCILYGINDKKVVVDNKVRISSDVSKKNKTIDFFIYSEDALNKEVLENREQFILDSGFFSENIFKLKENCEGFYILKPNGEYFIYYGSDYYSEVQKILKK